VVGPLSSWWGVPLMNKPLCLILGVILALFGIFSPNPRKRTADEIESNFKKEVGASHGNLLAMVLLGLGASSIEAATMLPYLAGIGIITNFNTEYVWKFATLAAYCLIMILPALVIIFSIRTSEDRAMARIKKWIPVLQYEGKITLLWIAAIVGIRMAILSSQDLHLWGG
ncbi:GAP family protein, partial [uncultured Rothia sp.]|uniref:GAP family protein n=1 Tax=uncultured Rothia sp. TaxID=316088 RepID=UPI0032163D56